jgi:hypothetical protein
MFAAPRRRSLAPELTDLFDPYFRKKRIEGDSVTRRHRTVMFVACGTRPMRTESVSARGFTTRSYWSESSDNGVPVKRQQAPVSYPSLSKWIRITAAQLQAARYQGRLIRATRSGDPIRAVDALLGRDKSMSCYMSSDVSDRLFRRAKDRTRVSEDRLTDELTEHPYEHVRHDAYGEYSTQWKHFDDPEDSRNAKRNRKDVKLSRIKRQRATFVEPQPVFDQPQPEIVDYTDLAGFEETFPGEHLLLGYGPPSVQESKPDADEVSDEFIVNGRTFEEIDAHYAPENFDAEAEDIHIDDTEFVDDEPFWLQWSWWKGFVPEWSSCKEMNDHYRSAEHWLDPEASESDEDTANFHIRKSNRRKLNHEVLQAA